MSKTDVLDILGISCFALCAALVWPPAALLVFGAAFLLMSWRATR